MRATAGVSVSSWYMSRSWHKPQHAHWVAWYCHSVNKKFELMLTRRAKAYSSSCSETVSLSPAILMQFILGVCATAEDSKNQ